MFDVQVGKTNHTIYVYFVDDDGGIAPGEPTTGLLFSNIETGGSASTMRQGAVRVDFSLVTQTVAGAHTDGGFIEIDATNMPGVYRLDLPDVFGSGADFVMADLVAASGNNTIMRPVVIEILDNPSVNVNQYLGVAAPALVGSRYDASVGAMAANVITAAAINAAAVTSAKFATGAINAAAIATDAITAVKIAANAITAAKINASAITSAKFATGAINAAAIATDAITAVKIAANAITSSQIATNAIGAAQFAQGAADKVWSTTTRVLTALGFNLANTDFAAGAIDANALATDAVQEIADKILPKKNTALNDIPFVMVLTTDHVSPATGLTVIATRSIDGGTTFSATTGTVTEAAVGMYHFDASAADMNGALLTFKFSAATADDTFVTIRTGG